MSQKEVATIYTDGASRGNPGQAAFAYVIKRPGVADIEASGVLPDTTNNVAEYTALIRALQHARRIQADRVNVCTDSELMVKQIHGSYRVKNEGLRPLYDEVRDLIDEFDTFSIRHVPRSHNAQADRLCNQALDHKAKSEHAPQQRTLKPGRAVRTQVREEAITCLRGVAAAWALGDPKHPKPEEVWDQLWSLLEEAGVVRAG
jgi:ribonuclease HI